MKLLILLPLLSIATLQANIHLSHAEKKLPAAENSKSPIKTLQLEPGNGRIAAAVFKAQEYCRAEVKDFEFDTHFIVTGASVYFTGANFKNAEKGTITSSSLKPVSSLMARCTPGSIIIFDEVKVIGPDNKMRTIPGISIVLY